jgi:ankyrin repeat protein
MNLIQECFYAGNLKEIESLITEENINLQDDFGTTALMAATYNQNLDLIKLLLKQPKIDLTLKDTDNKTLLDYIPLKDITLEIIAYGSIEKEYIVLYEGFNKINIINLLSNKQKLQLF